jgi:Ser/Thr protein kinase RdoA (MazF antagonist)
VRAELEFVRWLAAGGVPVVRPVKNAAGEFARTLDDEGLAYTLTAFTRAPGKIAAAENWTGELFECWGTLMGQLHRLSRDFTYSGAELDRPRWHQDDNARNAVRYLAPEDRPILDHLRALKARIEALPTPDDAFGLIHADVHYWNMAVDAAGRITLFDFDNCEYGWFAADIATTLFEAATCHFAQGPRDEFLARFWSRFWAGYEREFELCKNWRGTIPLFLEWRKVLMYSFWHKKGDITQLSSGHQRFLAWIRAEIVEGRPFTEFAFA